MLVLSRRVGEEIVIGDNVRLVVVAVRGNQVRLGFEAPREVPVRRGEIAQLRSPADALAVRDAEASESLTRWDLVLS